MTSVKFRLAQLYEPCDCHKRNKHEMHYISFDETFQRLREVTDDVLEHLGSRRDVLKFVLGQTYVLPKEGKAFDFKKHKTWSKKGIREQWDFLTDKGFNDIVVIGCVEDDLIRNDACVQLRDPEKYAYALKQRLIMHYAYHIHSSTVMYLLEYTNYLSILFLPFIIFFEFKCNINQSAFCFFACCQFWL
jgi:hypothetical protein